MPAPQSVWILSVMTASGADCVDFADRAVPRVAILLILPIVLRAV